MKTTDQYAAQLYNARQAGELCEPITEELTLAQAYDIQSACNNLALASDRLVGYKIGATSNETLDIVGLEEPFYGPLYASELSTIDGTAQILELVLPMQYKPRIEAEFVVCLKHDIIKTNSDVTLNDINDHIDWIAPGFEIVGSRFSTTIDKPGKLVIADFGANQHMVVGNPYRKWHDLDLTNHKVSLTINDQEDIVGHSGMSLFGNPLAFVCWLLEQPSFKNTGLKAGQMISCGTCTGAPFLSPGDMIQADYGVLGQLAISINT